MCIVGLALNFGFKNLVMVLGLPLYLDNFGTVLVAALGGILPGMIVGFSSNILASITDPISIYFACISAGIALVAGWVSESGRLLKPRGIVTVWCWLVFLGGVCGSFLSWNLYGGEIGGNAAGIATAFSNAGMSPALSQLSGDIIIDLVDKTITLIPVLLLLRAYPKKLYGAFPHSYIYEEGGEDKILKYHRASIRNKLNFLIIMSCFVTGASAAVFGWSLNALNTDEAAGLFLIKVLSIEVGIVLFVTAIASIIIERYFISNLMKIRNLMKDFQKSDKLTWLDSKQWITHDPVTTEDEIQDVYDGLCDLQHNVVDSLRKATEANTIMESQNAYLNVLSKNYFNVVTMNLDDDTVTFLKGDYVTHEDTIGMKIKGIYNTFDSWAQYDLTEESREEHEGLWTPEILKKKLQSGDMISHEMYSKEVGWVQVQLLVTRRHEDGEVAEIVWLSRIMTAADQDEMESQRRVSALAKDYQSAYYIDMEDFSWQCLSATDYLKKYIPADKNAQDALTFWVDNLLTDDEVRPVAREFLDLTTLDRRLREDPNTTFDYPNSSGLWSRGFFIPVDYNSDGSLRSVIWASRVVDIEKKQALALEAATQAAEKASAAKTDFLSAMSHDIRTPMNAISGMVDIALRHEDEKEKVNDSLKKIKSACEQMNTLINDVLDISAIESGKLKLKEEEFNVIAAFDQYTSLFRTSIEQKSLESEFDIHDITSPWVSADELRMRQIFLNLLSNSIKYTPEGGKVGADSYQETGEDGRLYTVGVFYDTGIGMTPEFMETMWDSFSRATDTRINKIQGAGLGLNIVKKLVDMMGGTIEVESEINKGSTFTVRLPLKPVEHVVSAELDSDIDLEVLDVNVLLAEDNDMNWEIAQELLGLSGITCTRAVNGEECLEMFTESPEGTYDAIFMDMQMPVMDGVEATKRIRGSQHPEAKTIPILAMTANAFTEDIETCKAAGMNDHFSKPIDVAKVVAAMKKYIKK